MNIISQIKTFGTGALKAMNRHRMEIAAGAGIFSIWISNYLTYKETPKFVMACASKERELGRPLTKWEKVKLAAVIFLPTVGTQVAGTAAIVYSTATGRKNQAAMAALYSASEKALDEYQKKVVDKIGEKESTEARKEATRENYQNMQPPKQQDIRSTGHGDQLCYMPAIDKWFRCAPTWLSHVNDEISNRLYNGFEMEISFNEVLGEVGLKDIPILEDYVFTPDHPLHFVYDGNFSSEGMEAYTVVELAENPVNRWITHVY